MRIPLVSPTSILLATHVSRALGHEVYVKHDNATHPRYGGNKVRKLEYLLADARAGHATDILTIGATGSHHVLATTVHGTAAGLRVEAVLVPQPYSAHVETNLRADLSQGATLHPVLAQWQVPLVVARRMVALRARGRVPYFIPPGGSTALGSLGYVDAVAELAQQLAERKIPRPDVMFCALGSGGTLAGLLAGVRVHGFRCEVRGVRVTDPWMSSRAAVAFLARGTLALSKFTAGDEVHRPDVHIVEDQLGRGYGHPTDAGRAAQELFARDDIALDLTYTAKAAAGLIAMARKTSTPTRFLFWNTLSSSPVETLITDLQKPLPEGLRELLRASG